LREFEDQLAALRKENFNLKLRIYFLEEKPATSTPKASQSTVETMESVSKRNIDLKVASRSIEGDRGSASFNSIFLG
jgi:hypothetical protein